MKQENKKQVKLHSIPLRMDDKMRTKVRVLAAQKNQSMQQFIFEVLERHINSRLIFENKEKKDSVSLLKQLISD